MASDADMEFMRLVLKLAEKGRGKTAPNPMVGAILVKNGRVVSQGYHRAVGKDHAEIVAIKNSRGNTKGAALYVNLEPCCHTGRTGPCTDAIIHAGISKVVMAMKDPNPLVNGKSIRKLKKAGIKVNTGMLKKESYRLNDAYISYYNNNRPFVILKVAQTLDGRVASSNGDSRWISSPQSLRYVHRLRSEVDAVVVGMGTVLSDNPSLTTRLVKGKNPYRIVLSVSLKFPRKMKLIDDNYDYKTIIATTENSQRRYSKFKSNKNLIFWNLKKDKKNYINLYDFIEKARDFNLHSLLIEGGSKLATSFIKSGLIDKYIVITAPMVLGSGINSVGELNIKKLSQAVRFENSYWIKSGDDNIFIGYPAKG